MSGQIWATDASGGYMYSDELSDLLRVSLRPNMSFRQFLDAQDANGKAAHHGDTYTWNIYSDVSTQGDWVDETTPIPQTQFTISQRSLTVREAGNSVPYTGKLEMLAKHDLERITTDRLELDARRFFDGKSYDVFKTTPLRAAPTGGTSTTDVTITENSATAITNNVALKKAHVNAIIDEMLTRGIPPFHGSDYAAVSDPQTFRPFKDELESVFQYTESGIVHVFNGEMGRYESTRFVRQNNVPRGGANDSTTFNATTRVADEWNNGLSSWAFFFGADTGTEGIVCPEEIRAKIPGDFGRDKGIAWYYLGGFGLIHAAAADARIIMWDSAA